MYKIEEAKSIFGNSVMKLTFPNDPYPTVVICVDRPEKKIICFSSQIGCSGKCLFCMSSKRPLIQNLTYFEMVEHCKTAEREMNKFGEKPILFSCMGEGEPLHNIDHVMNTFATLGKSVKDSKFALSTSVPKGTDDLRDIIRMLGFNNVKVQISLHSVLDSERQVMMPHSMLVDSILNHIEPYTECPWLELNFTLLSGINDSIMNLKAMDNNLYGYYIKINRFNRWGDFVESPRKEFFVRHLQNAGHHIEEYSTDESSLRTGCGVSIVEELK